MGSLPQHSWELFVMAFTPSSRAISKWGSCGQLLWFCAFDNTAMCKVFFLQIYTKIKVVLKLLILNFIKIHLVVLEMKYVDRQTQNPNHTFILCKAYTKIAGICFLLSLQSGPLSAGQVHWKPPSVLLQRADG
jgi:hypothetical protein